MVEGISIDKKSLKALVQNPSWDEIAKDCVCFANSLGGQIYYGIEDNEDLPPKKQRIEDSLPGKLIKNIQQLTYNVGVQAIVNDAPNGGQYIDLWIRRSQSSIASTTSGRYYHRVDDECKPVLPDELLRLTSDRAAFVWELQLYLKVSVQDIDQIKLEEFIGAIKKSPRLSTRVKDKSAAELLDYYYMTSGGLLTNLGILWLGRREHRARLLYAPAVQYIKYDERGKNVFKLTWDDYSLNPKELISNIWQEIIDLRQGIEFADGLVRKRVPDYDEEVVRELLANAIVHRPYTTRGDIFINLFPDRLEIHNPGLLPLGVTPKNILHKSEQRNPHLARVFYDLQLMEKEGSGYDRIYESLLSMGKPIPEVKEGSDRVSVTIRKRISSQAIIHFMSAVSERFILSSKELITLGLVSQHNALTAIELQSTLGLERNEDVHLWIGKLLEKSILQTKGKSKGTIYFVNTKLLKDYNFKGPLNLKAIDPIRLQELILKAVETYGPISRREVHDKLGEEFPERRIRHTITILKGKSKIKQDGKTASALYSIVK